MGFKQVVSQCAKLPSNEQVPCLLGASYAMRSEQNHDMADKFVRQARETGSANNSMGRRLGISPMEYADIAKRG